MSKYVRVDSVDKLKEFRSALCSFGQTAATVLDESCSEIRRADLWLKQDRYTYWKNQVRLCAERLSKAKRELKLKKDIETSPLGGQYSFVDEKKALLAAQRDFEQAERKFNNVRHWIQQVETEAYAFKGLIQGLTNAVEIEIPNARAQMDRMIDSLEAYIALVPSSGIPTDSTEQTEDMSLTTEPPESPVQSPENDLSETEVAEKDTDDNGSQLDHK